MPVTGEGPYNQFDVNTSASVVSVRFERGLSATGPWVVIQEAVPLLQGRAVLFDYGPPIGVPVWYQVTTSGPVASQVVGPYTAEDTGQTWLTDPVRPWADIGMDTCPPGAGNHRPGCPNTAPEFVWGGFTNSLDLAADTGLFPVLNAERPADVFARRKFATGSFKFFTTTLDAIDRVYDLFTAGGPLMLRTPPVYGWRDAFIQPGDLSMTHVSADQRRTLRQWDVPFTVVDRPFGPTQGTNCNNWCAVTAAFPTFADLTATPGTWLDLLQGDILCPAVP